MKRMPVIFIGHGTPMNAIEKNKFSESWKKLGTELPKPKAILAISAHWYTNGVKAMGSENPKMVYDMYGFPKELYEVKYSASGLPNLAKKIKDTLGGISVTIDNHMGFDHGIWSILCNMYPVADIPVIELSIDRNMSPSQHYELGKKLQSLRNEGVLIIGSGNVVHNFRYINFDMAGGYEEAVEFDEYIKNKIIEKDFEKIIEYKSLKNQKFAFETPEHFLPLLYILGASSEDDRIKIFNNEVVMGALSMTSYIFQ